MDLAPLFTAFTLFALMEFGDKTHLAIVALSARSRPRDVFLGATAAFALVDGSSILLGDIISGILPGYWLRIGSGTLFLAMGIHGLTRRGDEGEFRPMGNALLSVFGFVALMELGDKTQLVSFALAARYGSPGLILLGIVLASAMLTGSGMLLGRGLFRVLPRRYLRYVASGLFIVFGGIFLAAAILGLEIL